MSSKDYENASERIVTAESQTCDNNMVPQTETEESRGTLSKGKRQFKSRSKAWEFFKKVKCSVPGPSGIEIVDKAQCIFCKKELSANSKSNGTIGLLHHLKICKQNPENCQQTILTYTASESQGVDDNNGSLKNWKFDQEDVRKALAYMIIIDELPFRFVERAGFQYFMRTACPLFFVPSRWTMVRDCYMMYDDERLKLKAILKKSACRVCLTTDTWTSIQRINYLCLTAHFIDDNWSMNKRILNFVPIRSHRGEDIGLVIENCLRDWEIKNVFTITVDNAASNNTAIEYLRKKLASNDGCLLKGKYLHMRCIAHIINLVVVDGLKSMNHSISRIRNAVRYVRQSPSRWAKFKECISLEKIDNKSHVTLDVRTRWNSTYIMLESAVKFETAFERLEILDPFFCMELCSKDKGMDSDGDNGNDSDVHEENGVPIKSDWENARRFVNFLSHFYTLTVKVSGTRYVTSNTFFTEIIGVLYVLEEWQRDKDKDKELATMAARMKQKYDKYWGNAKKMNMIIYIAVVLDPRYKLEYLQWTFSEIYKGTDNQVEAMDLGEMVKIALYEMFNEYMRIHNCVVVGGRKEGTATSML
ncbi:hypothetical protein QQ045_010552 [Rhodiola kirilowii]